MSVIDPVEYLVNRISVNQPLTADGLRIFLSAAYLAGADSGSISLKAAVPDVPGYPATRREYVSRIGAAVNGYLESSGSTTAWRNQARKAIVEEFPNAFYSGYAEAGGEETEDEDESWLTGAINDELSNVDDMFVALKRLRGTVDPDEEADARAEGYAVTLDSVYSEGKLRGNDNVMLTMEGQDGESKNACPPGTGCKKYNGQRHSAKWWRARDLIRRNGNENYPCGRWPDCQHNLYDDEGEEYTR